MVSRLISATYSVCLINNLLVVSFELWTMRCMFLATFLKAVIARHWSSDAGQTSLLLRDTRANMHASNREEKLSFFLKFFRHWYTSQQESVWCSSGCTHSTHLTMVRLTCEHVQCNSVSTQRSTFNGE